MKTARADGRGFSLMELIVVCAIMAIVSVIAIPQLVGMRRNMRSAAGPIEIKAQLRYARQLAMSKQRAVTFQYRTDTAEIKVIQHAGFGPAVLSDASYPLTAGHKVLRTSSLAAGGTAATREVAYGFPANVTAAPFGDTTTLTAPVNNRVNITFQPSGAIVDANGATANFALVLHHPDHPSTTARAVTVLGASGRVKVWRYNEDDQAFVE